MKKIISMALVAILVAVMTACGSSDSYESINKKIENKEALSQEDYSQMIDYLQKGIDESMAELTKEGADQQAISKQMNEKYPYADTFANALQSATDLDQANKEKLQKMISDMMQQAMEAAMKQQGVDPAAVVAEQESSEPDTTVVVDEAAE